MTKTLFRLLIRWCASGNKERSGRGRAATSILTAEMHLLLHELATIGAMLNTTGNRRRLQNPGGAICAVQGKTMPAGRN